MFTSLHIYTSLIADRYKRGTATEHTYRGDLQQLIEAIVPEVVATNEPKRQACGAPDYIITKNEIPVGYIEAKDIGDPDLKGEKKTGNKEQFDRYRSSLENLIFTDYLNFHLYRDGQYITSVKLAEIRNGQIVPLTEYFSSFENLLKDFCTSTGQTIKSSRKLAEMMAGKARMLAEVIEKAINSDEQTNENSSLQDQMRAFKDILIHDIKAKGFADIYAQTIAYGMFAARLHDPTLPTFSRQEAAELIPKTNPFLRKLFQYVAGYDLDSRIVWIVDGLADVFRATDVAALLKNFGKATQTHDPIIHFYETFLSEYDPKLRKARGVWYTPEPVVNFIVRAVDDILKTEFGVAQGLADTAKTKIKVDIQGKKVEQEVHRVQILDPATGTGTFLAEVVKHIYKKFEGQQGIWSRYVEDHLVPRLNGFELLMASYAMAHLKLDLLLTETGYKPTKEQRFRIYLTNSLEEHHPDTGTLFAQWLSSEANEANQIKRDTPVMCVIGNPPYSGISSNSGEWISKLIEDYKYVDGVHFNERKHWLNDDYVKFIRYGQHFIEKNGSGILAFINPHGFLDNPTFRGMRWHLLKTYDLIYTIDLHGNGTKMETAPDGSIDQNVFDIMQGVSITLFIKTGKKKANDLSKVFHFDLYGKREFKYSFLSTRSIQEIAFNQLAPTKPNLFFVQKNEQETTLYNTGFFIADLFKLNTMGFVTGNDALNISFTKPDTKAKINDLQALDEITWRSKYGRPTDARDWTYSTAKKDASENDNERNIKEVAYRPFDYRYTLYTGNSRGLYASPQPKITSHVIDKQNINFVCVRLGRNAEFHNYFLTNLITDKSVVSSLDNGNIFPLYLYADAKGQQSIEANNTRQPNLNEAIVAEIAKGLGLQYVHEKSASTSSAPGKAASEPVELAPIDILDYIYAVLHSPAYREKYKEFLKIDFPRVPYPKDAATFWQLVAIGKQIRELHLLESPTVESYITKYPLDGSNVVAKPVYKEGKVYVNETQYFEGVPQTAWDFYIGGYQPAQKWLKDRKDRELSFEDILHYQKMIVALTETARLMQEVDKVGVV